MSTTRERVGERARKPRARARAPERERVGEGGLRLPRGFWRESSCRRRTRRLHCRVRRGLRAAETDGAFATTTRAKRDGMERARRHRRRHLLVRRGELPRQLDQWRRRDHRADRGRRRDHHRHSHNRAERMQRRGQSLRELHPAYDGAALREVRRADPPRGWCGGDSNRCRRRDRALHLWRRSWLLRQLRRAAS